jgi:hypothetical protein
MVRHGHAGPSAKAAVRQAREDARIVRVVPLLAVLVAVVAGVYLAWRHGPAGAREGGVVASAALLAAAAVRLWLPGKLVGLLANRRRATDVVTLTVFGVGLLVFALILPHQG